MKKYNIPHPNYLSCKSKDEKKFKRKRQGKNLTCVIYEQPHDMYMQQVLNILTLEVREK